MLVRTIRMQHKLQQPLNFKECQLQTLQEEEKQLLLVSI